MAGPFTERLAAEIARKGTTKAALAAAVGVHRATLHEWAAGDRDPSVSALAAMADYFGCSMDYLWGRSDHRESVEAIARTELLSALDTVALRRSMIDAVDQTLASLTGRLGGASGAAGQAATASEAAKTAAVREGLGSVADSVEAERNAGTPRTAGGRGS